MINPSELIDTARALLADGKGLLAMDESTPTCDHRFAAAGIPQTEAARRAYRELLVTTPGLDQYISGAILYDETVHQSTASGTPFLKVLTDAGIVPGIKVDVGAKPMVNFPGEEVTEGLDGLTARAAAYHQLGCRFAKWRAVIAINDGLPTDECIDANAAVLARYAAICQDAGLLPVVEPETLMEGAHDLQRTLDVTARVLRSVFAHLASQRVLLEGMVLKVNMVIAGLGCPTQDDVERVATATTTCLLRTVPAAVAGVAFLSGGQSPQLASARLSEINRRFARTLPWPVTFSYARAIQQPALDLWAGKDANVTRAQAVLLHRARCNGAARRGQYDAADEAEVLP
jgi:fructose-bisphosphate aldolase class I